MRQRTVLQQQQQQHTTAIVTHTVIVGHNKDGFVAVWRHESQFLFAVTVPVGVEKHWTCERLQRLYPMLHRVPEHIGQRLLLVENQIVRRLLVVLVVVWKQQALAR